MTVDQIKQFVQERKQRKKILEEDLFKIQGKLFIAKDEYDNLVESRRIISEAARITQLQFKGFVETLVTMAIQTVFPEEQYKFVMEFDLKSNRSEINLLVQQGEKLPYDPTEEQGGGLLDIISFALRVVMWSLEKPRSRPFFCLDEPFRYCGKLTSLAGNMVKEISSKLGIQILMVTHEDALAEIADQCWFVKREKGGQSLVENRSEQKIEVVETKSKLKRRK